MNSVSVGCGVDEGRRTTVFVGSSTAEVQVGGSRKGVLVMVGVGFSVGNAGGGKGLRNEFGSLKMTMNEIRTARVATKKAIERIFNTRLFTITSFRDILAHLRQ